MKVVNNLKLFIDPVETVLLGIYTDAVKKHNEEVLNNPYPNSGFDIYVPTEKYTRENNTYFIDHKIKATMSERISTTETQDGVTNTDAVTGVARGFCIYPRSSISKTPLILANHVGIIDSGYSGFLIGAFRHVSNNPNTFIIEKNSRLLQICHPGLLPFTVEIVEKEEDLFDGAQKTKRGSGGFGSTGV